LDTGKNIHVIVHGQRDLFEKVKTILIDNKFANENIIPAKLDKSGDKGEYVAMVWPPMAPKEIIISEIVGNKSEPGNSRGMGAWGTVDLKELTRMSL